MPTDLFMHKDATISECGTYRYHLSRIWDMDGTRVTFVMLNPSKADAALDDPTIKKCIGFARRWGHGGLYVVNLFALRSTDPAALYSHADPVGPKNDDAIACYGNHSAVVCAWGNHGEFRRRATAVCRLLGGDQKRPLWCLGLTKAGLPWHPLMAGYSRELVPFAPTME